MHPDAYGEVGTPRCTQYLYQVRDDQYQHIQMPLDLTLGSVHKRYPSPAHRLSRKLVRKTYTPATFSGDRQYDHKLFEVIQINDPAARLNHPGQGN